MTPKRWQNSFWWSQLLAALYVVVYVAGLWGSDLQWPGLVLLVAYEVLAVVMYLRWRKRQRASNSSDHGAMRDGGA